MDMSEPLRVDIVSDFSCPWCYIGKRRIESVLAAWKAEHPTEPEPVVRWLPFQLNPDLPAEGISRREHIERKHGAAGPNPEKQEYVSAVGRGVGLAFEFEKIAVQPNTLDAHRLSGCAGREGRQDEMVEALFRAHFMQGASLCDPEALAHIAATAGFDYVQAAAYLNSDTDRQAVERLEEQVRSADVDVVPFFVFNGKVTVSGAHEPKVLLEAIEQATAPEDALALE
jgi:predicted DsbA family dithiol-disulfide isomerase